MKKTTFTLPAEALGDATGALLLGDFNNWNLDNAIGLSIQKNGTLAATVDLEPGKSYEYRFLLNNGQWINDWNAQGYVRNQTFGVENSVIFIPEEDVAVEETVIIATEAPVKKVKTAKTKASKTTSKPPKAEITPGSQAKDDLTKIEGVGPKIARLLEAEGIVTFKAVGKATGKQLKAILEAAGSKFQMHDPASWPKQAKLAAAEKWEKLAELQATLKGGK